MLKMLIMVAPLALSTAAFAGPSHLSDAQYVAAARCQVLMSSASLGRLDTRSIDAVMRTEGGARSPAAQDMAQQAAETAQRAIQHAGVYSKAALTAERDGPCQSFAAVGAVAASAAPAGATRSN